MNRCIKFFITFTLAILLYNCSYIPYFKRAQEDGQNSTAVASSDQSQAPRTVAAQGSAIKKPVAADTSGAQKKDLTTAKRPLSPTQNNQSDRKRVIDQKPRLANSDRAMPDKTMPTKATPTEAIPGKAIPSKAIPRKAKPGKPIAKKAMPSTAKAAVAKPSPRAPSRKKQGSPGSKGTLTGKVAIVGKKNRQYPASRVVITLTPLGESAAARNNNATHNINMKNKTYFPVVQTVSVGDTLRFHNSDKIKHNVFSSSGENTFDLGTYSGGDTREIQLHQPGMVKVYCNIHPEMATFVMVTENPFHYITKEDGEFMLGNIPTGDYSLSLWHIRGQLEKTVTVTPGPNAFMDLTLNTSGYKRVLHNNKFGQKYKKKPALFEDEFY